MRGMGQEQNNTPETRRKGVESSYGSVGTGGEGRHVPVIEDCH